ESLIDDSDDLKRLVRSPVYSAEDQLRALSAVLDKAGLSSLAGNFLKLIARNRRLFAVEGMIKIFRDLAARDRGEVQADVTSATPLSDEQIESLKAKLKASIGQDVQLNTRVDPSVLGGLIVKVGSRMIDSSLRTKLATLKMRMKEVG
ncbi:MAG: F0F1 ATP synthase subunit delta, partial [Pseudomonadota bacterium]